MTQQAALTNKFHQGTPLGTVDIHTHLLAPGLRFDRMFDRVSLAFFGRRMGVEARALRKDPFGVYRDTFARLIGESHHVAQACLFGVDARCDAQGREVHRDRTVCSDNETVWETAQAYPDRFIPFFSINPLRPDALERIDEYAERGFKGAKFLQNYWGTDLNQERFLPYYESLVAHRLPLIVHIGMEYAVESVSACESIRMVDLPLAAGVTVIAAHIGMGAPSGGRFSPSAFSRNPRHFGPDYFGLLERLERQPNLYADLSATLVPFKARALRHLSQQRQVHHKLLFGTDYPVPFTILLNTYDLPYPRRREIARIDNPFDRYCAALLEYFPAESPVWSNYCKVLEFR